ncbi:MAG: enoyl-CoA hydratase/isomerase family protein [Proteobacteria bacterium]|nr:enoyl-CoA hydratase/isomerase family protein [Pseudomonadota bacterium]
MSGDESVVASRQGRIGRLLLNRPKALNALDLDMIRALTRHLLEWRDDPRIHAVVIEGAGGRAFCAGGDIRAVRQASLDGDFATVEAFFAEEYALNRLIAEYPIPYVALIDGICMGGGIGVSVHGAHIVASEHAMFAMPETAIGFFPDVGATYFLPRLPGEVGMYLGLTGARMVGADAVHAGLATQFTPRERMADLLAALTADGAAVLADFAAPMPEFSLAPVRATLDQCFGAETVPEILLRLRADGGEWAAEALKMLRGHSPSSVFWSHAIVRAGADRTLVQCLEAELALTRTATRHHEFLEGVRAMVVDKDRNPDWQPKTIEEVDPEAIAAMFR